MAQPDVEHLLRECSAISDKLNNLLTGIHLKAGMLLTKTDDPYIVKGLREISGVAEEAASYSAMLHRLSDSTTDR